MTSARPKSPLLHYETFVENYAWVDKRLEEMSRANDNSMEEKHYDLTESDLLDLISFNNQYEKNYDFRYPQPAPLQWVLYKNLDSQHCLEEAPKLSIRSLEANIPVHCAPNEDQSILAVECASVSETIDDYSPIGDRPLPITFDIDFDYEFKIDSP